MRIITSHIVNPANDMLRIEASDELGSGDAHHRYEVTGFDTSTNVSDTGNPHKCGMLFLFQNGPIAEVGVNGITHETLLAIIEDRLKCFQAGPYACRENAMALAKIQEAMMWLHRRTIERMRRGVEGTHAV